jgi:hypothetical protein
MLKRIELNSDFLNAVILPEEGGRISTLRCRRSNTEFLLQTNRAEGPSLVQPGREASFASGAVGGIEECLPTVARCSVDGELIPDHGDFWQFAWEASDISAQQVSLSARGFSRPLLFDKVVSLGDSSLSITSRITNTGESETSFLYAMHPLLAVDPGDRIALPSTCQKVRVYGSLGERLGSTTTEASWPIADTPFGEVDLSTLGAPESSTAEMLYTQRLQEGWCGLYRTGAKQGIVFRFDERKLPYLGLWICCGGWPDDLESPRQFAFAPEPTTAPCGSLEQALSEKLEYRLEPGDSLSFTTQIFISEVGCDFEEFSRFAGTPETMEKAKNTGK